MGKLQRTGRLTTAGGVLIAGALSAVAFCYLWPFDLYLLKKWESDLPTSADEEVVVRVEQIAALGARGMPTLVAALHSDRQLVAATAASVLRRELGQLELRSTDQSSRIIAGLASELATWSDRPGPYSAPTSTQLAMRLLLWPINRNVIDGEQLVADCERIIRSAERTPLESAAALANEDIGAPPELVASSADERFPAELETLAPVAVSDLPVQLLNAPPLPPQIVHLASRSPPAVTSDPPQFIPVNTSQDLAGLPSSAAAEATTQSPEVDSQQRLELRRDTATRRSSARPLADLRALTELELIQKLAGDDESRVREAVGELVRRGFQTKHLQLAVVLADPDPRTRLELVRRLPQMSGIDSRPWLLWLSRDDNPEVRKAAVAVIATSSDSGLQERVRELEREETDEDVLRVVRQSLNTRPTTTIR